MDAFVVRGGERPPLPRCAEGGGGRDDTDRWPDGLARLLRRCWAADPRARPSSGEVVREIEPMVRAWHWAAR